MPEPATPPAPPAPPAPETPPPTDPLAPQQYVPMSPENDADHQLKQMISRRRKPSPPVDPAASNTGIVPPVSAEAPAPPTTTEETTTEEPKPAAGFNEAIGGVLKFKPAPKKKVEPKTEEPAPPAPPEAPPAPAAPEPPKTIVSKKKAAATPPPPDITQIATAATTAAVRALRGEPKTEAPAAKPEDALTPADRYDYDVAAKLAEINPKYKDAPAIILNHVKKSEAYATRWETANPGKAFNPNDDEHSEFYDSLETPWTEQEFRKAATKLETAEETDQIRREVGEKIKTLERDNARLELGPIIDRTFVSAAKNMAKGLHVQDKFKTEGDFDKFQEEDPITAKAMTEILGPIHPLIEAIVQIDEPKGRFPIDHNNPVHQAWMQLLAEKEAQYAGVDNAGKMFASRIEYSRMNPAQRAKHWYLTADHLVSEVVDDAIAMASERVKAEKEKQNRIALSLGYVLPTTPPDKQTKTVATNGTHTEPPAPPNAGSAKPVSPSVGSGAKIDSKGTALPTGRAKTLAVMGDILFPPRNPVP